jgi:hypothetical protein
MFGLGRQKRTTLVRVAFRNLDRPAPHPDEHTYVYIWALGGVPAVGERVVVPGGSGPAHAVVMSIETADDKQLASLSRQNGPLKVVTRRVTTAEIAKATSKTSAALDGWLDMARRAAGLPTKSRRKTPPSGYPAIPPVDGKASADDAAAYGRTWYRLYKQAEEAGRDPEEVRKFKSIAHRWYAVRDKGGNLG